MNTKQKITAFLYLVGFGAFAQEDSIKILPVQIKPNLKISGYVETYYAYDFNEPENNTRPSFFYSHNRHNEVALNLGFIKAAYNNNYVRANLALMAGSYANANLAAEEGVLKNIYEANAGIKLAKNADLWVDAGIFASHIGFESAIGKDCWTLTRSMLADNSPYYESGAKISYTSPSGKWFVSGLVLNGWQRIQRPDGNKTLAFGHQVTYKPNAKITLNSSSFIGNDKPDIDKRMRYFHNMYGQFQFTDKFGLIAGFDIGAEQKSKDSKGYNSWYSPVIIAQYHLNNKMAIAVRGEYYSDKNGVIIAIDTDNGFKTFGYSANFDYNIYDNVVWRLEARSLNSKDDIFLKGSEQVNTNTFITTALAISF
ncbi:porin [Flavobacterium sp. NRK1]|uniref:porin n=1 Tax=Flavobacterium sp. NRK1 TaxID=2954929 RepID=UPI002092CE48|nr:porin [Flavobacterium sp. NRK1]MCO6149678.1 porin [Flavobacterium sp. NRK1]